jgi:ubiquinone/menaquinone biosynthesis C-methylase UbiE
MSEWRAFYERNAASPFGDSLAGVDYQSPTLHLHLVEAFRTIIGAVPSEAVVLDAACGNGIFWKNLLAPRTVIGFDFSHTMCKLARAKGMAVCEADAVALPFLDRSFDVIYCSEAIQYVADLPAVLAELARVCRIDGRIVISTVARGSWLLSLTRVIRRVSPREGMPSTFRARSLREVAAAAAGLPLVVASVARLGYPFARLTAGPLAHKIVVEFRRRE